MFVCLSVTHVSYELTEDFLQKLFTPPDTSAIELGCEDNVAEIFGTIFSGGCYVEGSMKKSQFLTNISETVQYMAIVTVQRKTNK